MYVTRSLSFGLGVKEGLGVLVGVGLLVCDFTGDDVVFAFAPELFSKDSVITAKNNIMKNEKRPIPNDLRAFVPSIFCDSFFFSTFSSECESA